jgi:hypothetical protein
MSLSEIDKETLKNVKSAIAMTSKKELARRV